MFTGIVEEVGAVKAIQRGAKSMTLTIGGKVIFDDLKVGDSIAVCGLCLTATEVNNFSFKADVTQESLNRSSLSKLRIGSPVNLERAMQLNGRFGGHIVSGHIDGTGIITSVKKDDNAVWYTIKAEPKLMRYIIEKGSVTLDGISLTIADVKEKEFSVSVIPHTLSETNLIYKKAGDIVNIENDCIVKYVEKLCRGDSDGITKEFLYEYGF